MFKLNMSSSYRLLFCFSDIACWSSTLQTSLSCGSCHNIAENLLTLPALKGNNSGKAYNFLIKVGNVQMVCCSMMKIGFRVMVFNATFNNISAISWQSALLVEETGLPGENHRPAISH